MIDIPALTKMIVDVHVKPMIEDFLSRHQQKLRQVIGTLPAGSNTPPAQMPGGGFTPADGSVTTVKLADAAVTTDKIVFGTVGNAELANDAVTTEKIADGAVTSDKVDGSIALTSDLANYLLLSSVSLTPTANFVPRAGVSGRLAAGWIPDIVLTSMVSGTLPVANGGTGATTATAALTALGGVRNAGNVVSMQAGLDIGKGAAGTAGRVYFATDTLRIYRDNGTTWLLIGSVQLADQNGTLNDTQHGSRSGGTLHAEATASAAGFLSAANYSKLFQLTIAAGKNLTAHVILTLAGVDGSTLTIPASGTAALLGLSQTFTAAQRFNGGVGVGTDALTNVGVAIGGTVSSPNHAFGLYLGGLILDPASGWSAYSQYVGGGTVATGSGKALVRACGLFAEAQAKSGTGSIAEAYGLLVAAPTIGTSNVGVYIGGGSTYALQLGGGDAAKPTGSAWLVTSDERTKKHMKPFRDGLAFLRQLPPPISYQLNGRAGTPDGAPGVGFSAQAIESVAPSWVRKRKAKLDGKKNERGEWEGEGPETDVLSLDLSALPIALLNAVRELADQVDALRVEVATIKGQKTASMP